MRHLQILQVAPDIQGGDELPALPAAGRHRQQGADLGLSERQYGLVVRGTCAEAGVGAVITQSIWVIVITLYLNPFVYEAGGKVEVSPHESDRRFFDDQEQCQRELNNLSDWFTHLPGYASVTCREEHFSISLEGKL